MPRPDEGLIHAWLDGQLPPDEAARIEQLAASDPEWSAAVAEARGLIAASSRILSALDHAPSGVIPEQKSRRSTRSLPWWTRVAAAVVVIVGGSLFVVRRANTPGVLPGAVKGQPEVVVNAPVVNAPSASAPAAGPPAANASGATGADANALRSKAASASIAKPNTVPSAAMPATIASAEQKPSPVPAPAVQRATEVAVSEKDKAVAARAADFAGKPADSTPRIAVMAMPTVANVPAARTAGGAAMPTRAAEPAAAEARRVGGIAPMAQAKMTPRSIGDVANPPAACFAVRSLDAATPVFVMRVVRTEGDTLRLESLLPPVVRAWIVGRDGAWQGAWSTAPAGAATTVTATLTKCPAPPQPTPPPQ